MGKREIVKSALLAISICLTLSITFSNVMAQSGKKVTGELNIAFATESEMLDPTRGKAGRDQYFSAQMFENLLAVDPEFNERNWLAESWQLIEEEGHQVIDVRIKKGIKFHTGGVVTAEDFAYSYERLKDCKISRHCQRQASVDHVEVIDDHHFKIHFKEPDADYISNNARLRLVAIPKAYYLKVGDDGVQKHPMGTGPWRFVSRRVKEELTLEAFDEYWNTEHRPGVKKLIIKIIPEDMTRVAAFKTKAVDWIDSVPVAMISDIKKMKGVKTVSLSNGNNLFLSLPTHMPESPFMDVRVRLAAAHAIDMDGIIKTVLFGQGERYASVGKGGIGYDPTLKPYEYDPEKAKRLLKEAGYPNGFEVPFYNLITPREPNMKQMGEAIAAYLTAAGIRSRVKGLEYSPWISLGARGKPPACDGIISWMWSHYLPGDPGSAWSGHLHTYLPGKGWGNYSYYSDPEFDRLIKEQRKTMDPVKRHELLKKIGRMKHEQVAGGLTTYRPLVTFAWRDHVTYTPWPGCWYRKLQEIGVK
jgi:peptide/nickel transport system substrate-binding protein